jgi:hypothetical protein
MLMSPKIQWETKKEKPTLMVEIYGTLIPGLIMPNNRKKNQGLAADPLPLSYLCRKQI